MHLLNGKYLDHASVDHIFRRGATHIIIKLTDRSDQLPRSLFVEDVELLPNRHFHRQGGYANVYRGARTGEAIAVKKPRLVDHDEFDHKVTCRNFNHSGG
jgi:hypothetical protein